MTLQLTCHQMIKNQRLEKRNRIVARAQNPNSGRGRNELPRFKVGDLVTVQRTTTPTTTTGPPAPVHPSLITGTVTAVDECGRLRVRYRKVWDTSEKATITVDPRDSMIHVTPSNDDVQHGSYRCTGTQHERHLKSVALAKQRHWEQQRRADDIALAAVVLSKRELLASGELCTRTSPQGVFLVGLPTAEERAALMRVLYTDQVDLAACEGPSRQPEPEPEQQLTHLVDYAQTPWPAHQDQALMGIATERLEQGDYYAALMLVKWATVTVDTTKHSLTYQKPKLAAKISKLQLKANQWMAGHVAYLPLVNLPPGVREKPCDSAEESLRNARLCDATRRLALATCLLPQPGALSPASHYLDFDTLRRTARFFSLVAAWWS